MEMGESLVASYFKYVEGIRMVVQNAPFDKGQGEMDLIVIDTKLRRVIFCEVTTHIQGMLYGTGYAYTADKVRDKLARARGLINARYTERIDQPRAVARQNSSATDEPAFRLLQILERLRR